MVSSAKRLLEARVVALLVAGSFALACSDASDPPLYYAGAASRLYCDLVQEYGQALTDQDFDRFANRLLAERSHESILLPCLERLYDDKSKSIPDMSACIAANQWARDVGVMSSQSCTSAEASAAAFLKDMASVLQGRATWGQTTSGNLMGFVLFACQADPSLGASLCDVGAIPACAVECDRR